MVVKIWCSSRCRPYVQIGQCPWQLGPLPPPPPREGGGSPKSRRGSKSRGGSPKSRGGSKSRGGGSEARTQELDPRGAHLASISGPRATQAQVQISRRTNLVILLTPPLSWSPQSRGPLASLIFGTAGGPSDRTSLRINDYLDRNCPQLCIFC